MKRNRTITYDEEPWKTLPAHAAEIGITLTGKPFSVSALIRRAVDEAIARYGRGEGVGEPPTTNDRSAYVRRQTREASTRAPRKRKRAP